MHKSAFIFTQIYSGRIINTECLSTKVLRLFASIGKNAAIFCFAVFVIAMEFLRKETGHALSLRVPIQPPPAPKPPYRWFAAEWCRCLWLNLQQ